VVLRRKHYEGACRLALYICGRHVYPYERFSKLMGGGEASTGRRLVREEVMYILSSDMAQVAQISSNSRANAKITGAHPCPYLHTNELPRLQNFQFHFRGEPYMTVDERNFPVAVCCSFAGSENRPANGEEFASSSQQSQASNIPESMRPVFKAHHPPRPPPPTSKPPPNNPFIPTASASYSFAPQTSASSHPSPSQSAALQASLHFPAKSS